MKQRKSIDLNSKLSLEALVWEDGKTELTLKVGKKEYRIAGDEIQQLANWLSLEVLKVVSTTVVSSATVHTKPINNSPTYNGPSNDPLENRRFIPGKNNPGLRQITGAPDLSGIELVNLSGQMDKAVEAFSPTNLNKDVPL